MRALAGAILILAAAILLSGGGIARSMQLAAGHFRDDPIDYLPYAAAAVVAVAGAVLLWRDGADGPGWRGS